MAAAVVPITSKSLWQIQEDIAALLECVDTVTPEQEPEFLTDLRRALEAEATKVDSTHRYLCRIESDIAAVDAEIKRLREYRTTLERRVERIENNLVKVIQARGTDRKGKYTKLEGHIVTTSVRALPASVLVFDESRVPAEYKRAIVQLPAMVWNAVASMLPAETLAAVKCSFEVSKSQTKDAISSGVDVPGADLELGGYALVRR